MTKALDQETLTKKPIEMLRASDILAELSDEEITSLAGQAQFEEHKAGEVLKGDSGRAFYFILEGQVRVTDKTDKNAPVEAYLFEGNLGGEFALLGGEFQAVTEEVAVDSTLATFDQATFDRLISTIPDVARRLRGRDTFLKRKDLVFFEGQRAGEAVVVNVGRHFIAFMANLPGSILLMILGMVLGYFLVSWLSTTAYIISGCLIGLGGLLTLYVYLDWRNDRFIITNQRIIHIERILLHGETRHEAPLTAVQDVSVRVSGFLANIFDYSDLHIRTAGAGTLVFDGLKRAESFKDEIFRQRQKAQDRVEATDVRAVREKLKDILGLETGSGGESSAKAEQAAMSRKNRFKLPRFINFFIPRVKEVQGEMIIWRKNYFVFLKLVWAPLLVGLVLAYFSLAALFGFFPFSAGNPAWFWILGLAWLVNLVWYAYQYDTWRKDDYRVTRNAIIDYKGSAFNLGPEQRRVGTFDVIQNSTYVTPNFWAKLLNIGHVVIETAGTEMTFTFFWVYNPVEVQQEIFRRWLAHKEDKIQQERAYEEKRFVRWLGEFHDLAASNGADPHQP